MARIHISKDPSGRIIVCFPYNPLLVERVEGIDGRRWHPVEKHWSFPELDGILETILKVFGGEDVQEDRILRTASSKATDTPSPLAAEGQSFPRTRYGGEGYNFEDLRRELVSRKYSYKTAIDLKGYFS